MNKREVVWLIVRLIGVYFVYCSLFSVFTLASAVTTLYSTSGDAKSGNENTAVIAPGIPAMQGGPNSPAQRPDPSAEKGQSDAFKSLLLYIFLSGLYGAAAFYLIRRGDILFNVLNNESLPGRKEKDPTVTTLRL